MATIQLFSNWRTLRITSTWAAALTLSACFSGEFVFDKSPAETEPVAFLLAPRVPVREIRIDGLPIFFSPGGDIKQKRLVEAWSRSNASTPLRLAPGRHVLTCTFRYACNARTRSSFKRGNRADSFYAYDAHEEEFRVEFELEAGRQYEAKVVGDWKEIIAEHADPPRRYSPPTPFAEQPAALDSYINLTENCPQLIELKVELVE